MNSHGSLPQQPFLYTLICFFTADFFYNVKREHKLDVLECFEDANHSLRIGDMLNKQAVIYEALGVDVPTSSC